MWFVTVMEYENLNMVHQETVKPGFTTWREAYFYAALWKVHQQPNRRCRVWKENSGKPTSQ